MERWSRALRRDRLTVRGAAWAFHGRVSYLRSAEHFDVLEDAWYLVLTLPICVAGTFDEVTGAVSYVDLRRPHYEATVELLEAY